jgi:hypothetical protein
LVHVPDVSITDLSVYLEQSKWYRGYWSLSFRWYLPNPVIVPLRLKWFYIELEWTKANDLYKGNTVGSRNNDIKKNIVI